MHKKLAADLTSLAHEILQLKNKEDVVMLKEKAYQVYEKLTLLAFVDEYLETTPVANESKAQLIEKISDVFEKTSAKDIEQPLDQRQETSNNDEAPSAAPEQSAFIEEAQQEVQKQPTKEVTEPEVAPHVHEVVAEEPVHTLDAELENTISLNEAVHLFEKAPAKRSLNDQLHGNIQIGLNDRIAFVKNLFDGSQEDFNRVVSQLNTFHTEKEAKRFIHKMVKPDYNWTAQETYEERFMAIISRKFD